MRLCLKICNFFFDGVPYLLFFSRTKLLFYMVRGGPNNTRIVKLMTGKDRKPSGKENRALALECDEVKTVEQFTASPCSKSDKV